MIIYFHSRILRKDKAPASKYDMASEEWSKVNADIQVSVNAKWIGKVNAKYTRFPL